MSCLQHDQAHDRLNEHSASYQPPSLVSRCCFGIVALRGQFAVHSRWHLLRLVAEIDNALQCSISTMHKIVWQSTVALLQLWQLNYW